MRFSTVTWTFLSPSDCPVHLRATIRASDIAIARAGVEEAHKNATCKNRLWKAVPGARGVLAAVDGRAGGATLAGAAPRVLLSAMKARRPRLFAGPDGRELLQDVAGTVGPAPCRPQ